MYSSIESINGNLLNLKNPTPTELLMSTTIGTLGLGNFKYSNNYSQNFLNFIFLNVKIFTTSTIPIGFMQLVACLSKYFCFLLYLLIFVNFQHRKYIYNQFFFANFWLHFMCFSLKCRETFFFYYFKYS